MRVPTMRRYGLVALCIMAFVQPRAFASSSSVSGLCLGAASKAEAAFSLPGGLLHAISDVETGRPTVGGIVPWPWTVQAGGEGLYFPDKASAIAWVEAAQARGVASIDVGCMQINLMYHPRAFVDLESAFDPVHNAVYAAHFLQSLRQQSGDWKQAIGFYHSQTASLAGPYRDRVERLLASHPAEHRPTALETLSAAWSATLTAGDGSDGTEDP